MPRPKYAPTELLGNTQKYVLRQLAKGCYLMLIRNYRHGHTKVRIVYHDRIEWVDKTVLDSLAYRGLLAMSHRLYCHLPAVDTEIYVLKKEYKTNYIKLLA